MKEYRKKLIIESSVLGIASAVLIAVQVLAFSRVIQPVAGDSHWKDMWNGFVAGASAAIMALFLIGIVINLRALTNEAHLKKLYAKENDERTQQIQMKGQAMGMRISLIVLMAATIVLGYFDVKMSLVCLCCVFAQSMITVACKLYWHHAM